MKFIKCINCALLLCMIFSGLSALFSQTPITFAVFGWCTGITFTDTLYTYRKRYR